MAPRTPANSTLTGSVRYLSFGRFSRLAFRKGESEAELLAPPLPGIGRDPDRSPPADCGSRRCHPAPEEMRCIYREARLNLMPLDKATKFIFILCEMRGCLEGMALERVERRDIMVSRAQRLLCRIDGIIAARKPPGRCWVTFSAPCDEDDGTARWRSSGIARRTQRIVAHRSSHRAQFHRGRLSSVRRAAGARGGDRA